MQIRISHDQSIDISEKWFDAALHQTILIVSVFGGNLIFAKNLCSHHSQIQLKKQKGQ